MNQLIEAEAAPIPLRSTFGAAWGLRRPGCEDVPPAEDGLHLQGAWPRPLLNFERLTKGQSDRWPSLPSENQNARHAQAQKASLYRGNRQNFSEASDLRKIRLMSCTIAAHNLAKARLWAARTVLVRRGLSLEPIDFYLARYK